MTFRLAITLALAICATTLASLHADDSPASEASSPAEVAPKKELFRGRVLRLPAALGEDELDNLTVTAMEDHVVLKTREGELIPILGDWRGRAFLQDKRLRDREVELVGFRRPGIPYLQVLMVFTFDEEGNRQYTDYWCDVCSIPMYEVKPCECCQGETRLRFQPKELPDYIDPPQHNPAP